jgi:hypothetical protein
MLQICLAFAMSSRLALIKRCSLRHDAKTRAAVHCRAKLDAMSEAVSRPPDDEKPKSEAFGACRVQSKKRFEYALQLIRRNALTRVVDFDANGCRAPSAADEDAAARRCMVDGVTCEIAQDPV